MEGRIFGFICSKLSIKFEVSLLKFEGTGVYLPEVIFCASLCKDSALKGG